MRTDGLACLSPPVTPRRRKSLPSSASVAGEFAQPTRKPSPCESTYATDRAGIWLEAPHRVFEGKGVSNVKRVFVPYLETQKKI